MTARADDGGDAALDAFEHHGEGGAVVRTIDVGGTQDDQRQAFRPVPPEQELLGLAFCPGIGDVVGGMARMLLADAQRVPSHHQRGGDVEEPPEGDALHPQRLHEPHGGLVDAAQRPLKADDVGDDRSRVDDAVDPGREADGGGFEEVAPYQPDGQALDEVEVRGLAHEAVHLPSMIEEVTAQVRTDEPVGPRDEDARHAVFSALKATTRPGPCSRRRPRGYFPPWHPCATPAAAPRIFSA